ncbi:J domain-containing protein [Sulfitobacter sp.]|uniref:J domain-containing protein n=1 Tax=Sulfitobacter sp. TaxID=1903071 RepID=UPI0030025B4D
MLELAPSAGADNIRKAFRKAARKYHPDINSGADPERLAAYDQLGQEPPLGQGGYHPPPGWDNSYAFSDANGPQSDEAFSDFFEELFRRGGGPAEATCGGPAADSHGRIRDYHRGCLPWAGAPNWPSEHLWWGRTGPLPCKTAPCPFGSQKGSPKVNISGW